MQIAEDSKPLSGEKLKTMEHYREQLLAAGMLEPTRHESSTWHWLFYKPVTPLTAFIVNLRGCDAHIEVVYGYASTAFTRMANDENALIERGVRDEEINIREKCILRGDADEESAKAQIRAMYDRYLHTEKDDLLLCAKTKRKEFIQLIAVRLKPLGFKKKANSWTRPLEGDYYVMFNAQKSAFSDEYYFNVYIGKNGTLRYGDCYSTRIEMNGSAIVDWQAETMEDLEHFFDDTVVPALQRILDTPLPELGKSPELWSDCSCDRRQCDQCWVEKNLWEAKASEESL